MPAVIIIPIYNAYARLEPLFTALARTAAEIPVIAINDASPDQRVGDYLQALDSERFASLRLLENPVNQGFVATVNRGIQMCDGDVIILNQDTVVTGNWYQNMLRAGELGQVATVTPLTNNGEIASLPEICVNHPLPEQPELMARACVLAGQPGYPEIPTAVGFCMLIKRACIDAIGLLDAGHYGHGYGEENDYSCRARAAGLRNLLCDDAYVGHVGNQSFQDLGLRPNAEALQKVLARYPDYMQRVRAFIEHDPLREKRLRIDAIYRQLLSNEYV